MGSTISNILGAFSLGLLFYPHGVEFDRSAKVYAALLLAVTTLVVVLAFFGPLNQTVGGILIAIFCIYIGSIFYAIRRGVAAPPDLSDSDSDGGSSDSETGNHAAISETSPLVEHEHAPSPRGRHLIYHVAQLVLGFISLSLSGYILSHSAISIADALHLSGTVFGLTVVSFATTLPEKRVAVLSGSRDHGGIMAATTAGSNIFLLTLCLGIVATAGYQVDGANDVVLFELVTVSVSSLLFWAIILLGEGRRAGVLLLVAYVVFLGLEFTVYRP